MARQWFDDLKSASCCAHCGQSHPATLEWHHNDPSQKSFTIAVGVAQGKPLKKLEAEAAKCTVLCSNCHRIHHYNDRQQRPSRRLKLIA